MYRLKLLFCALLFVLSLPLFADDNHGPVHANAHAPIGVMGDHMHKEGEWMFSLRAMRMSMKDLASGSQDVSVADYFAQSSYMMAPTEMDMNMVMMGVMYAPSDSLTLMLGLPYVENTMDIETRIGMNFSTSSYDIGDLKLTGLIRGPESSKGTHSLHFNVGISVPTGDINHTQETPMSNGRAVVLPYPMQVGAGSYVATLGFTYNGVSSSKRWTWGLQPLWMTPLNLNNSGYKIGDHAKLNTWLAFAFGEQLSLSLRAQYEHKDNYDGSDSALNPMMAVTADPELRGYDRAELFVGLNYAFNGGHRLALEFGKPFSERLEGPQMKLENSLILGWQKAF